MRLKKIQLKNFLSFYNTNTDIIIDPKEPPYIFIINGINYDNDTSDSSNGSGKSAFISESIMYNIYGKGLRGTKQKVKLSEMIRHGAKEMSNSIEYFINDGNIDKVLNIKRTKTEKSGSTEIFIDGESKSKRLKSLSDSDIKTFIDLDPDLFTQIIVYYRDNLNLLSMNYSQRLELFKKIINLEIIDEYYEKSKIFKNSNEKYLDYLKNLKKNTEDIIEIINNNKDKYKDYIIDLINIQEKELYEIENKEFESTFDLEEESKNLKDAIEKEDKKIKDINNDIIFNKNLINKIDSEIKKIQSLSGGECPTCKQQVSNEYVYLIEKEYSNNKKEFLSKIEKFLEESNKLSKEKDNYIGDLNIIKEKLKKIEAEKVLNEQNVNSIKRQIKKLNIDLQNLQNESIDNKEKNKYDNKLKSIIKAIDIRNDWKESINYWYTLLSPKSTLRASIIRKYIVILSDIFEYYISKLYNNEIIGKIEIDDDGNIDIILFKDSFETNYWQMSSGERKRVDIAMILSLYEFTSYIKPNLPKFLILDEVFDSLDSPGISAVIETLIDVQKRHEIDLFIISHIAVPINSENVKNILVTKKDKNSNVKILEKE